MCLVWLRPVRMNEMGERDSNGCEKEMNEPVQPRGWRNTIWSNSYFEISRKLFMTRSKMFRI